MGCTDFKQNENKYAPDITFSVEGEMYWGYIKGFTVEINGTNESTLEIVNKQYESVLYTLKEQEKQD
jgi:hypothetical protein